MKLCPYRESLTRLGYRDRCLTDGLGRLVQGHPYKGSVVPEGTGSTHQCPGVAGSNTGSEVLHERSAPGQYSDMDGQYDHHGQYQPSWGNTLSSSEQSSNSPVEVVSGKTFF